MKKPLLLALALLGLTSYAASAQQIASCCARPKAATEAFAMLANDDDFVGGHDAPLPFHYQGAGEIVEFATPDGQKGHAFAIKSATPSTKYLLVFQEWWGLNDYIKQEAATLARELPGVNVLALDLYDGQVATTPAAAGALMQAVKTERAQAIIRGALNYAGPKAEVATIGWCFGGGWSLQAALLGGKQTVGCVMYYGMPEADVARLKTLNTDVLGIFALKDDHISPAVVGKFEQNMKAAGKKLTVHNYDAVHAFANPSNPNYDKAAAGQAHELVLKYLQGKLHTKS